MSDERDNRLFNSICIVVTDSMNLHSLYRGQFAYLRQQGFEPHLVAGAGPEHDWLRAQGFCTTIIPMARTVAFLSDLWSLLRFFRFFSSRRFDLVIVSTPKASLIASIAAKITRQPMLIYILRGRIYENLKGLRRRMWDQIEKFICWLADGVISISVEMKESLVLHNICPLAKIEVIGAGSGNGVDLDTFTLTENLKAQAAAYRQKRGIKDHEVVFIYSGRFRSEKGLNELIDAWRLVRERYDCVWLFLQGRYESHDLPRVDVIRQIDSDDRIFVEPWVKDNELFFAVGDVFVFPTHREGFGNVAIEAAAMGLPVVAFDVMGCRESVQKGISGILCTPFDHVEFADRMMELIEDSSERQRLGASAIDWVSAKYDCRKVWKDYVEYYRSKVKMR